MVTTGFQKDIAHIIVFLLLSKAGTKLKKGGVTRGLMNDLSKALECILLDLFNAKLHAPNLDSHTQRPGNAYLGRIKAYLGFCQTSVMEFFVKIDNGCLQLILDNY